LQKTIALMDCEDHHVALVAQAQIREFAWGKPQPYDPKAVAPETLTDPELDAAIIKSLIQMGLSPRRAAQLAAASHDLRDDDETTTIEGEAETIEEAEGDERE
jgi:hypothetical protein